jgi:23S rRNA pseudouridine2605 synthase
MTKIRLNRFISGAGISSVRGADELIRQGRVFVNGAAVTDMGILIDPKSDRISVDGEEIRPPKKKSYFLFFKPKGVVSTMFDPEGRPCIADFTSGISGRLFPVGRLDYDADGLMILTSDGDLANRIMHPSSKIRKTYQVKITGSLGDREIEKFKRGVPIDGKNTLPAKIIPLEIRPKNSWYEVTITEGKNRQIKRMFSYFKKKVTKIKRISIGPLSLEGMAPGEIRKLKGEELKRLMDALEK